ncbi:rhamnogalacturonate lyase C [Trichophyton mentagrophytes]|nr:rhamnogalacturonate lyase C [Trichophyton mentagrophytes]
MEQPGERLLKMPPWDAPSAGTQLLASPLICVLRPVYGLLSALRAPPYTRSPTQPAVRVVCLSDTHSQHRSVDEIPDGDLLIHAGDLTDLGTPEQIQEAADWLKSLPHRYKVVVAGNHDGWLDAGVRGRIAEINGIDEGVDARIDWGGICYLQNSSVTLEFGSRTLTVHGIPQIPQLEPHVTIHAFQYPPYHVGLPWPTNPPAETDILVSHSPPLHHGDLFPNSIGCAHLLEAAWRVKPALYVFGHTHAGRGVERVYYDDAQRAWEMMLHRRREGGMLWARGERGWSWWLFRRWSVVRDLVSVCWAWRDAVRVVVGSLAGVIWTRIWGGERPLGREGWMVNPACMDVRGQRIVAGPIVVDL